jgi:hypothetical protein
MDNKSNSDFNTKVMQGLKLCYKRLVKSKIQQNESIVIMHNGKIITIKASELKNL